MHPIKLRSNFILLKNLILRVKGRFKHGCNNMDTTKTKPSTLKKPKTQKKKKRKKKRKRMIWSMKVFVLTYCRYSTTSEANCYTKRQIALAETTFEFVNSVILEDLI
jgi:hypothetical protein